MTREAQKATDKNRIQEREIKSLARFESAEDAAYQSNKNYGFFSQNKSTNRSAS